MFTLPDLLANLQQNGGVAPTFDAQAVQDSTDLLILAAGFNGCGVPDGNFLTASTVVPCTVTGIAPASPIALSSLNGTTNVTMASYTGTGFPPPGGYFTCPTSGGGTALCGYASYGGSDILQDVFYISGGSGNIPANATLTFVNAVYVNISSWCFVNGVPWQQSFGYCVSIKNPTGTAFQAVPTSSGDRKDLVVVSTAGVVSIQQGNPVATLDWTRNNGANYTTPAPAKPALTTTSPTVLAEIYIPGTGSALLPNSGLIPIQAGQITDKSLVINPGLGVASASGPASDVTLVNSNTFYTVATSASLPIGEYLVLAQVDLDNTGGSAADCAANLVAGTATLASGSSGATGFVTPGESSIPASSLETVVVLGTLSVVAAGTVILQAKASVGSSAVVAKQNTVEGSLGKGSYLQIFKLG